ncbi:MgtC/SapB family protein [Loigolactobacillus coryniformis]|uniref:MgtC/SapB family protein n=1 Tax=Loigolactobacillus coryniformis TaxID=1610 RepID=UPI0023422830|nr:MgtC/SapB family protein [Loigolactobacillus coryniformis]MDC4186472.1 MgtC/SapB family protein [Loigolactobacillus coryniformis]
MQSQITTIEIIVRLFLTVIIAGMIGYDREYKNRPAGIRTHILVCVGACVIALIQQEIGFQTIDFARSYPKYTNVVRVDEARLIAQVISGVGFLGAGTIIVTRHSILGLTTAASLWATAGLGIATGMGYYEIAMISAFVVIVVLTLLQKIIHVDALKKVEIKYRDKVKTKNYLQKYFISHHIEIYDVKFSMEQSNQGVVYTNIYKIKIPRRLAYTTIIEDISMQSGIVIVRLINI